VGTKARLGSPRNNTIQEEYSVNTALGISLAVEIGGSITVTVEFVVLEYHLETLTSVNAGPVVRASIRVLGILAEDE